MIITTTTDIKLAAIKDWITTNREAAGPALYEALRRVVLEHGGLLHDRDPNLLLQCVKALNRAEGDGTT